MNVKAAKYQSNGHKPNPQKELEIMDLAQQVNKGEIYPEILISRIINSPDLALAAAYHDYILEMTACDGSTVALYAARHHEEAAELIASKLHILKEKNNHGAVAHSAVVHEAVAIKVAEMDDVLVMYSKLYGTVAHVIADKHPDLAWGQFRAKPEILGLVNEKEQTVLYLIKRGGSEATRRDIVLMESERP